MNNVVKVFSLAVAMNIAGLSVVLGAPVSIDTFLDDPSSSGNPPVQFITGNSGSSFPLTNTKMTPAAVGGVRTLIIDVITGPNSATIQVINFMTFINQGGVDNGSGVESITRFLWDAGGAGLGGVDFTDNQSNDSIGFDITSGDPVQLTVTMTDIFGRVASDSFTPPGVGPLNRLFANFLNSESNPISTDPSNPVNINFQKINSVQLEMDTLTPSADFTLNFIQGEDDPENEDPPPSPPPDPPSGDPPIVPTLTEWGMVVLVLGLAGLAYVRVRKLNIETV